MNKQVKTDREGNVISRGIGWCDWTWNPIGGCFHACRWNMPDGSVAQCYAESQANRQRSDKFYAEGFAHHYWHPDRLKEPLNLKTPAGIFLDSFSDLMGHWVPDEQIKAMLDVCRRAHWHTFQLLTKNAPRLRNFDFPPNVWVGASMPPSIMNGIPLSAEQQKRMLLNTLTTLAEITATVKWISFEPLSFDPSGQLDYIYEQYGAVLGWAVIGAASNGPTIYQPDPLWVTNTIRSLRRMKSAIFFKSNLSGNKAAEPWLEEFPVTKKVEAYEQRNLI